MLNTLKLNGRSYKDGTNLVLVDPLLNIRRNMFRASSSYDISTKDYIKSLVDLFGADMRTGVNEHTLCSDFQIGSDIDAFEPLEGVVVHINTSHEQRTLPKSCF